MRCAWARIWNVSFLETSFTSHVDFTVWYSATNNHLPSNNPFSYVTLARSLICEKVCAISLCWFFTVRNRLCNADLAYIIVPLYNALPTLETVQVHQCLKVTQQLPINPAFYDNVKYTKPWFQHCAVIPRWGVLCPVIYLPLLSHIRAPFLAPNSQQRQQHVQHGLIPTSLQHYIVSIEEMGILFRWNIATILCV
jgi:hypothetical protein